ncbi:MAG TPA: hypothetical protein ENJ44_00810 [Oceanospirillales bacterium]|nr:hypothetical protein [Oceanospirillales bacterium]
MISYVAVLLLATVIGFFSYQKFYNQKQTTNNDRNTNNHTSQAEKAQNPITKQSDKVDLATNNNPDKDNLNNSIIEEEDKIEKGKEEQADTIKTKEEQQIIASKNNKEKDDNAQTDTKPIAKPKQKPIIKPKNEPKPKPKQELVNNNQSQQTTKPKTQVTTSTNKPVTHIDSKPKPITLPTLPSFDNSKEIRISTKSNTEIPRGRTQKLIVNIPQGIKIKNFTVLRGKQISTSVSVKKVKQLANNQVQLIVYADINSLLGENYSLVGIYQNKQSKPIYLEVTL